MVTHQHPSMHAALATAIGFPQAGEESLAVVLVFKNHLAPVPASDQ